VADAVETLLVLSLTALNLAVVPGRVGTNQFMANAQGGGSGFKERLEFAL
jgi:hypothetical protein